MLLLPSERPYSLLAIVLYKSLPPEVGITAPVKCAEAFEHKNNARPAMSSVVPILPYIDDIVGLNQIPRKVAP